MTLGTVEPLAARATPGGTILSTRSSGLPRMAALAGPSRFSSPAGTRPAAKWVSSSKNGEVWREATGAATATEKQRTESTLEYLEAKGHGVCNLLSSGSEIIIYRERGRGKMRKQM